MNELTWGKFKEIVEAAGTQDDFVVEWIDINFPYVEDFEVGMLEVIVRKDDRKIVVH